ncbi:DUF3137 domain-containing protein [Campylobacter sp. FMV-PI01]|uniref:DUF3137 domain-containing protein n=1 Tax=Campylobacter portucalensis TaxID=2608384 RepID=A0A6L5WJN9_9BACT|nr:DUF3137 domain-containing protein [Campylobacter portucalensis]MSN96245.1 DUF3137 domain-containing protein [Campylobacter portucalensis]
MTIDKLEKLRKEIYKKFKIYIIISFCINFGFLSVIFFLFYKFIGYKNLSEIPMFFRLFLFLFFIIMFIFIHKRDIKNKKIKLSKPFRQKFKNEYLRNYIKNKGHYYNMYHNIDAVDMIRSGLFKPFTNQKGNDYISGMKNGVMFKFSDILLEDKLNLYENLKDFFDDLFHFFITFIQIILNFFKFKYDDKKIHNFTGLFFVADFNKNINSKTLVMQSGYPRFNDVSLIKMDSVEFNSKFRVYSDDIQNAMYLLSPSLMEKIYNLSKRFNNPINVSFIKTKIYISINVGRDSFEPDITKNIKINNPARKIISDLNSILDIVNALNLDNDLWKNLKK